MHYPKYPIYIISKGRSKSYANEAGQAHMCVVNAMKLRNPGSEPQVGDRVPYVLVQTKDPKAMFILSHYHGDHYQQLPKEYKYQGPAKIHCTPITARLLVDIHQVPDKFVVPHDYGCTFETAKAKITFYDANHAAQEISKILE